MFTETLWQSINPEKRFEHLNSYWQCRIVKSMRNRTIYVHRNLFWPIYLVILTFAVISLLCSFQRGTDPTYLDITVRSYNGDERFDVAGDMVFTFTCDTESALPAAVSLDVDYK